MTPSTLAPLLLCLGLPFYIDLVWDWVIAGAIVVADYLTVITVIMGIVFYISVKFIEVFVLLLSLLVTVSGTSHECYLLQEITLV
jgi:hypothetical protein